MKLQRGEKGMPGAFPGTMDDYWFVMFRDGEVLANKNLLRLLYTIVARTLRIGIGPLSRR